MSKEDAVLTFEEDISWWKRVAIGMGIILIIPVTSAVIGSVFSLPINPSWLRAVLLLALIAAWVVSGLKWHKGLIVCIIATVSLLILAIIRIILGHIEWTELWFKYGGGGGI